MGLPDDHFRSQFPRLMITLVLVTFNITALQHPLFSPDPHYMSLEGLLTL